MRLTSVRELKVELLSTPLLVEAAVKSRPFAAFVEGRQAAEKTMTGIALGVTPGRKDHRLAVRLQESGPFVTAMTEEIRERAKGEVDIRYVGKIVKFQGPRQAAFYQQRRRPLRIGSSISDINPEFRSAGTLGCFVSREGVRRQVGLLTNNHVIASENRNPRGTPILQPGTLDGGHFPADQVAGLGRFVRLRLRKANYVDAAIGNLAPEIAYNSTRIGNLCDLQGWENVVNLPPRAVVHKVGRTTGQTHGRVTAFDVDNVRVRYDMGLTAKSRSKAPAGASGDSGSLIVDDELDAIGLLFAGGNQGGSNGKGLTYANPIDLVLDALKVEIEL